MAIIDVGMTQDEVMEAVNPAPEGDYLLTFEGFLENPEGEVLFTTKKGGKMAKAKFTINSTDPKADGKRLIYNGVVGSFSFANLCKALPIMSGTGIDTEGAISRQIKGHVTIREYENPETGEKTVSNDLSKMSAV
jgi:hypothetical protein